MHACLSEKVAGRGRSWVERIEVGGGSRGRNVAWDLGSLAVNLKDGIAQKGIEKAQTYWLSSIENHILRAFLRMNFLGPANKIHSA
jgi:hypothetical protein